MIFSFNRRKKQRQAERLGRAWFTYALERAKTQFPELFETDAPAAEDILRQKRFEAVSLYMSAVLWWLKTAGEEAAAQAAHDAMFLSFDRSLREGGVGDIGVSHKIKKFAQAFYGRLERYTTALDNHSAPAIAAGLQKNMALYEVAAKKHARDMLQWSEQLNTKKADITKTSLK